MLIEEVKEKDIERKVIYQQIEVLNSEISDAENKKAKAEKKINATYNKVELIEKGMKELERKLQITTTTRE
jgi:septal ring factor EnvC (AmiA/AmiB activator)